LGRYTILAYLMRRKITAHWICQKYTTPATTETFKNRKILLSYIGDKLKMELTKISSKGQIVIPLKIRSLLGINEGSVIAIDTTNEMVILKKVDVDLIKQFKDSLADVKAGRIKRVA